MKMTFWRTNMKITSNSTNPAKGISTTGDTIYVDSEGDAFIVVRKNEKLYVIWLALKSLGLGKVSISNGFDDISDLLRAFPSIGAGYSAAQKGYTVTFVQE